MEKRVRLSIIIVNFNTYKFLTQSLNSIYQGNLPSNSYEIILIDNASSDNSVSLIRHYFPKVSVIANKKNVGFAKANNQGIKKAKGDYILLLNPDTLISDNILDQMLKFMEENNDVGVSTCRVELSDGKLDDSCHRGFPTPWNAICHFSGLSNIFPFSQLFNGYHLGYKDLDRIHEIDSCSGAFMLIRQRAGEQVGWFDEDYFWYGEDLDFCYRVKEKGWKVMFIPQMKIIHYKGVSSGIKKHSQEISTASRKTKKKATKARFKVMEIFYKKHYYGRYPRWMTSLVMLGIKAKECFSLREFR